MKTKAKLRFLRISPRKVRLLIDLIRGMRVEDAVIQLENSKKNAAKPVLKLLKSAIANAKHNHEMKEETLRIVEAYVDGGPVLKRWMPRAFGRASGLLKRTSHVTIVLEGEADEKPSSAKASEGKKKKASEAKSTEAKGEGGKEKASEVVKEEKIKSEI